MNDAQRELLIKTLADIAKGLLVAAAIAGLTGKASWLGLSAMTIWSTLVYAIAHRLAGKGDDDE